MRTPRARVLELHLVVPREHFRVITNTLDEDDAHIIPTLVALGLASLREQMSSMACRVRRVKYRNTSPFLGPQPVVHLLLALEREALSDGHRLGSVGEVLGLGAGLALLSS